MNQRSYLQSSSRRYLGLGTLIAGFGFCLVAVVLSNLNFCDRPPERVLGVYTFAQLLPPPLIVDGENMEGQSATRGVFERGEERDTLYQRLSSGWRGNTWDGVFEDPAESGAGCDGGWIEIVSPSNSNMDRLLSCQSMVLPRNPSDSTDLMTVLKLLIDPHGNVAKVLIETESGDVQFDNECIVTAYSSKYHWFDDEPVGIWVRRIIRFVAAC